MTNKEAVEKIKEVIALTLPFCDAENQDIQALNLAIKALEERDDLIERAYGHIVGQGTQGVIRPDDLQGWRYEE